jgi:hypothetical protein
MMPHWGRPPHHFKPSPRSLFVNRLAEALGKVAKTGYAGLAHVGDTLVRVIGLVVCPDRSAR